MLVPNIIVSPSGRSPRDPREPELDAFDEEEAPEKQEMDFYMG